MQADGEVLYEPDADQRILANRVIAVIGYGNQGRAQVLNLRDSGCRVVVGSRTNGNGAELAKADGFEVRDIAEAAREAGVISILLPDQVQPAVYERSIRPVLSSEKLLLFGHGFAVHFGLLALPDDVDVALVAPIGPGKVLRQLYLEGFGVPALLAVQQDVTGRAWDLALAYAAAIGCARAGLLRSTFAEETETDLFGEQAVLCGGLTALIRTGFETLVEAGYRPELAYFECVHQVKLIADLIYEMGIAGMNEAISDTAEFGEYQAGPRVIGDAARYGMRKVLSEIRDGTFARKWMDDVAAGNPELLERRARKQAHALEGVGQRLRTLTRESS